ncbi:hypothetical protein L484_015394 [Morus notabilis]|uniref:Uncharacterized protein n=1 Tax=Morus notabilis TaxID=981085 RepID=W9RG45_9ROSA|nr:hypothetical protein L484_015394 [Morus notabilis]
MTGTGSRLRGSTPATGDRFSVTGDRFLAIVFLTTIVFTRELRHEQRPNTRCLGQGCFTMSISFSDADLCNARPTFFSGADSQASPQQRPSTTSVLLSRDLCYQQGCFLHQQRRRTRSA